MPEPHEPRDPLAAAFKSAAAAGRAGAVPVPVSVIMARGDRVRLRRFASFAVAACLAVCGTSVATAMWLPSDGTGGGIPATSPSGSFSDPAPSAMPSSTPSPTQSRTGAPLDTATGTAAGTQTGTPSGPSSTSSTSPTSHSTALGSATGAPTRNAERTTAPPP
ncbi:hypothetical protein QMK19_01945 [Streptomyces sp. H10-C2]|uniref:hypothetical protein n=1 Tax=unclassified Streptomyces TaxID=2593676 RepID=UPI0024B8C35B|nr:MULTISPECIES: hypothetical protein [unclassified Streptomyces]MDJ0342132.1 hypothetical protein [Streptomyces sp. PH10-H1]MDJ0368474.1 hypothetical protein [Streptomyces sp. H10-C2]